MTNTKRTNKELADLAVERALECGLGALDGNEISEARFDHAKKRGTQAAEVFLEQIDNTGIAFDPSVVEIAYEWVFYSGRFGVVAEIHNGVYSNVECAKLALAIVEMDRKLKQHEKRA